MGSPTQTEMWEEERDEALNGNLLDTDEEEEEEKEEEAGDDDE